MKRLHAVVEGRVQGVGFRYFVQKAAQVQQVTGWVRNQGDGSVEVLAEGEESQLDSLLAVLHKGPSGANVSSVEVSWGEFTGEFTSFRVRWT